MPSSKLSKASRSAQRKQLRNRLVRSSTKTRVGKVGGLISAGELELAQKEAGITVSSIDKAVSKGIWHKNKGARLKSRLVRKLNAAAAGQSNITASEVKQPHSEEEEVKKSQESEA